MRKQKNGVYAKCGCTNKSLGYIYISIDNRSYLAHRIAWAMHTGDWPDLQIDHINHIRNDNRIINLREVSIGDNRKNQSKRSSNKSGATGVFWYSQRNKWVAYIRSENKRKYLGYYIDFDDAVAARQKAERLHGFHPNHGN